MRGTTVKYTLFSVDDHIIEHPRVWTDRLPQQYQSEGPHVVEEEGREYWQYEDKRVQTLGLGAVAGKPFQEVSPDPVRFEDMLPSYYDPKERAKAFDADGIVASVAFPTLARFSGAEFVTFKDKVLAELCVKAYNDFVLDEWCAAAPGRFVPMVIGQLWDPPAMAQEIYRCAERGARALAFPESPATMVDQAVEHRSAVYDQGGNKGPAKAPGRLNLPSFHGDQWDPVFNAVTETDMVICIHCFTSGVTPIVSAETPLPVLQSVAYHNSNLALMDIIMSPVPVNFPTIKFALSESGMGWVPAALEKADKVWTRNRYWAGLRDVPPSEIFRQNFWVCAIDEPKGMSMRHLVGVDKILWECDFPHSDSPWPHSQKYVDEMFHDVVGDDVAAITHGNASALFRWPLPSDS
jgi:predicted TIM-barrel fold metal-dependent hydrolase